MFHVKHFYKLPLILYFLLCNINVLNIGGVNMSKLLKLLLTMFNGKGVRYAFKEAEGEGVEGTDTPDNKEGEGEESKDEKDAPAKEEKPKEEKPKETKKPEAKKAVRKTKAELEAEIRKLQEEYDRFDTDVTVYTQQIDELTTSVTDLEGQIASRDEHINALESVINEVIEAKKKVVGENIISLLPEGLGVLDTLKFLNKAEAQIQADNETNPKANIGKVFNVDNGNGGKEDNLNAVQKMSNIFGNYFKK